MYVPAYEIGAVFFLVVLVMAGTMTSGLFPRASVKTLKGSLLMAALLFGGFAIYHWLPDLSNLFDSGKTQSGGALVSAPAAPAKQAKPKGPEIRIREVQLVQEPAPPVPAQVVVVSAPPEEPTAPAKPEKGAKHVVKSVGRFLHLTRANSSDADPAQPDTAR